MVKAVLRYAKSLSGLRQHNSPLPAASRFSMTKKQGSWDVGTEDPVRPRMDQAEKERHTLGTQMADEINLSGINMIFVDRQPAMRRWEMRIETPSFKKSWFYGSG